MFLLLITILSNPFEHVRPVEWEGNLANIFSATIAPDGGIFFVDTVEGKIYQTNLKGEALPTIGKKGEGPYEFNWVENIFYEGEHLYAYDAAKDRLFQIDKIGQILKSWRLPNVNAFSISGSKIRASLRVPKSGHLFGMGHLGDSEVKMDRLFGGIPCCITVSGSKKAAVLSAKDGTFWMSHTGVFQLDQYNSDGKLLTRIDQEPPEFDAPQIQSKKSRFDIKGRSAELMKFDKIDNLFECGDKILLYRYKWLGYSNLDVFTKKGQRIATHRTDNISPIGAIDGTLYGFLRGDETTLWDIMLVKVYQDGKK